MREILFRGKTLNGEFREGKLAELKVKHGPAEPGFYISNSVGMPFAYPVRPETVGQYTGLKDKNGVKIFEGDIIRFGDFSRYPEPDITVGVIRWKSGCFSVDGEYLDFIQEMDIEIIGNIYGNMELLEEGK